MRIIQTVICLLILPFFSWAQKATLSGKVLDATSNEPLPFVNIVVSGTSIGTVTDIDGHFVEPGALIMFGKRLVFVLIKVGDFHLADSSQGTVPVHFSQNPYFQTPVSRNPVDPGKIGAHGELTCQDVPE